MNRKLSENNLKINALKRSQMMKSLEFQKLVTRVDRFFFDHKLYDLMKKKRSRKVNTNDHQFDFYSILLELLYEVHRNDSSEQARLFERVLEWYQVNQVKLEFPKNVVPTHVSATQSSECSEESKISKKPSPSVRPTNRKNIIGKINRMQLLDQKCTDEDGICSSVTTVKSTPSKAITTSEFVTLTDFSESRNVTEQHTPTEQHQKESFQPLIERSFHAQIPSQKKALQDSFFTKKGSPNLSDVINTITTPHKMAARKRAQSVPVHLFRNVSMDGKVNSPQAGTPRSAKGNIYHDWRGLISPESSGHVVEFQRTLLQNMDLRNRRQTLVPQSNVKKALGSLLTRGDHKVIRFQDVEAIDESGTSAWRNAATENTQSKSLQRSQPEQIDQSTSNLSRFFCHNCQVKLQHRINCVLCLERYCKMQGVYSANLPDLHINQSQDANMVLNQQQFDSIRAQGNVAEKADQSLCNCKKIKITSNELSDQSEDVSVANRQHISTTESSFDKLEMNKTLDFGTELQEHDGTFILTSRSKGEHHKEMKRDALYTSPLVDENIFQASQTIEEFVDTIPKTSADEDFLPLIAKTGHLLVKLGEDQQVHLTVLKPIDFQKYSRSTFDYQQTMQAFHLSIIGHHIGRQGLLEGKAEEYSKLQKVIKKPADIQMEPTKAGRPIGLHFQPKHRAKVEKAIERQKSVNSAVDIHDIITQYINKEYELDVESIQNEKIQKKLKEHGELKRRHKEFTEKIKTIYRKPLDVEIKARNKILLKKRRQHEINKKVQVVKYQRVLTKFNAERSRRLEESTPHLELIEASYPQLIGPSPYRQKKAAVFIQKFMRGWLVRKTHIRIKNKASGHGKSLKTAVKNYRLMMNRIRRRFDAHWEAIPFVYPEFEEWLDRKKKYENMFAKREFWKEINRSDLPNFFKDCDHYPSQREINDTLLLINSGLYNNLPETLNKKQVVELAFTIYPPSGAGLGDRSIYRSTWVRPVVDGEEGFKYILSEHPVLKEAKIEVVGRLVARSISERNAIRRAARNVTEDYFLEDTCLDKITSGR